MKDSEREYVFSGLAKILNSLTQQTDAFCEIIDYIEDAEDIARKVSSYEDVADSVSHDIHYFYQENKLIEDKEALCLIELVKSVEECTDLVEEITKNFVRYNVTSVKSNAVSGFMSARTGASKMEDLINSIRHLNRAKTPIRDIIDLDNFSAEYKRIYDINMNKLFTNEKDPIEVIRWNAIYDSFKNLFEAYERVAEICGKYYITMG